MRFSIIIPAYNEEKYLDPTLARIETALTGIAERFEVMVVDNCSEDGTLEIAEKYGTRVINETVHNIGRVRTTGANAAQGEVLIFLDADTLVPDGLFQRIEEAMENPACFGGAVAVKYDEFERSWLKYYMLGWRFWNHFVDMKQGAAQFCRKSAFTELNGYDETIYVGEDIDFYWRLAKFARRNGGHIQFIEDLPVTTSARRLNRMSLPKMLLLTNPIVVLLQWRRQSLWKDWYEKTIR